MYICHDILSQNQGVLFEFLPGFYSREWESILLQHMPDKKVKCKILSYLNFKGCLLYSEVLLQILLISTLLCYCFIVSLDSSLKPGYHKSTVALAKVADHFLIYVLFQGFCLTKYVEYITIMPFISQRHYAIFVPLIF